MRERTPSADDTPKKAPPAPPREAASVDIVGGRDARTETWTTFHLSSPTAVRPVTFSTPNSNDNNLVVVKQKNQNYHLDNYQHYQQQQHQQQQHQQQLQVTTIKKTAQDKRSRLSNVINNLRKKVPESGSRNQVEGDEKNSVERNLETLEKYVMTVLNGVIKDAETDEQRQTNDSGNFNGINSKDDIGIDLNKKPVNYVPSEPSAVEPAVPDADVNDSINKCVNENNKLSLTSSSPSSSSSSSLSMVLENNDETTSKDISITSRLIESRDNEEITKKEDPKSNGSNAINLEKVAVDTTVLELSSVESIKNIEEIGSLGTIILSRLNETDTSELINDSSCNNIKTDEIHTVCCTLLDDIINKVNQTIDESNVNILESSTTSLHCSLPLDKVGSILQVTESIDNVNLISTPVTLSETTALPSSSSPSPSSLTVNKSNLKSPSSPIVRHLCLYCDRKFLSISLRQRHTERVHQQGGGRRSERNPRKTNQNCQYCSEKCNDNLDSIFQHMISNHSDKYYACVQCKTRYSTRDALQQHTNEIHEINELDKFKNVQITKDTNTTTSTTTNRDTIPDKTNEIIKIEFEEEKKRLVEVTKKSTPIKLNTLSRLSSPPEFNNPDSPEFDVNFYKSVSCNIRDNLLHHIDGKLKSNNDENDVDDDDDNKAELNITLSIGDAKQQRLNEPINPIDISLTAATPVYNNNNIKEYKNNDESQNSSEYAQKANETCHQHPRRVSFEKYNFPKKYDGKEQWNCSLKDLSKFDINTQLTLRKKQDKLACEKLNEVPLISLNNDTTNETDEIDEKKIINTQNDKDDNDKFTSEFGNFMRLKRWDECKNKNTKNDKIIYAELTGEWSRPRVYICGACYSRHLTLKEIEDHKLSSHPNVWCSHLEFSGDQLELYKHLFLPGRDLPTSIAKNTIIPDKICTKCLKTCSSLAELHRHMLECGGDQAWLLGLFGNNAKKKCKWRPFGSRSRRRKQRGMKRNIQNSQTPRANNEPRERQSTGPRVRPSDQETIQKMIANLPPKRLTRRVAEQEATSRSQARLRKIHAKSRPETGDSSSSNITLARKTVLRNKLLKNAKSFQRKRCRGDNISAAIESVINSYENNETATNHDSINDTKLSNSTTISKDLKKSIIKLKTKNNKNGKIVREVRVVSKRKNIKIQTRKVGLTKVKKSLLRKTNKDQINESVVQTKTRLNMQSLEMLEQSDEEKDQQQQQQQSALKKKKSIDSLTSLNASLKAKSQLRTHDGKFAKNPDKNETASDNNSSSSSQNEQLCVVKNNTGTLTTRSQIRSIGHSTTTTTTTTTESTDTLTIKRSSRLSLDNDKMPTLELAEKNQDTEKITTPDELPILTPAMTSKQSASITQDDSNKNSSMTLVKKNAKNVRGKRRKRKNRLAKRLENQRKIITEVDVSESLKNDNNIEATKEPRTRSKKSLLKSSSTTEELPTNVEEVDVEQKNSIPELPSKKNNNNKVFKTRHSRQIQNEESLKFDEVPTVLSSKKIKKKIINRKLLRSNNTCQIVSGLPAKTRRNFRKIKQKIINNQLNDDEFNTKNIQSDINQIISDDKSLTSKSPTLFETNNKKEMINTTLEVSNDKIQVEETCENLKSDEEINNEQNSIKSSIELEVNDTIKILEQGKIENSVILENEEEKIIDNIDNKESCCKNIVTADLVSLSFEHLQQESSNSNIDSGKENSSETPVNISKPKITRPKKSRGFRRDRVVKRSINNVIGILTEGVNIPVDVQQSVVLTVQTSVENINTNNNNNNNNTIQNNRNELVDNNNVQSVPNIITDNQSSSQTVSVDVKIDAGNDENTSQELQCPKQSVSSLDENQQLKLNNVSEIMPIKNSEITNTNIDTTSVNIEPPTNDIILDLSRRKQKGKGSFLEKIVSKIAKQKDVLLDGEVGSLLDSAVDELSIILDEVGTNLADNNEIIKTNIEKKSDEENINDGNLKDNNKNVNEICENKNTPILNKTDEILTVNEKNINTVEASSTEQSCTVNILNSEIEKEVVPLENSKDTDERISKKRSLEIVTLTKNKRKSIQDNEECDKETQDETKNDEASESKRIEEDICLADIMKLINTPKTDIHRDTLKEKNVSSKRKNCDKEKTDNSSDVISNNKKKCGNSNKKIRTEGTRRSTRRSNTEITEKINDEIDLSTIETNNLIQINQNNKSINSENNIQMVNNEITINQTTFQSKNEISFVSKDSNKMNDTVHETLALKSTSEISEINSIKVPEIKTPTENIMNEKMDKSKKRNSKKKNLINEKLLLTDNENTSDNKINKLTSEIHVNSTENKEQSIIESSLSTNTSSIDDDNNQQINDDKKDETVIEKSFKVPEVSDVFLQSTSKRSSKKKSLTHDNTITTDNIIPTIDNNDKPNDEVIIPQKNRKSSKRKNNNDGNLNIQQEEIIDKPKTIVVERRQTLRRKAKENIFLIEELLDMSGDEMDSPTPLDIVDNEISKSKDKLSVSCENKLEENSEKQINVSVTENETLNIKSQTPIDEPTPNPKKHSIDNFSVGYSKTGEILIVEKKKKFTKEIAKFFCNICTTSFTRKSSLKKHNQSQSHILQVTKSDNKINDNKEESMSHDDTTVSSIDRSEDITQTTIDNTQEEINNKHDDNIKLNNDVELKSKIDIDDTKKITKKSVDDSHQLDNNDFEDELLDEEICKITENMTHDEYVLTDHISPEGASTPSKETTESLTQVTDIDLKSNQQKLSLSNQHLEINSPIISKNLIISSSATLKSNEYNNLKISPINDSIIKDNVCLDFSNITEKLKSNEFIKNNNDDKDSMKMDFDSDENSSSINMSNDINKLIDNSEINIDSKGELNESIKSPIDNLFSNSIKSDSSSMKKNKKSKNNKIKQIDNNEKDTVSMSNKKIIKTQNKSREIKLKNRNKQSKKKSVNNSSDSELDEHENLVELQNKNKIVKSVFGRVFGGEKIDKVKEVLDDWVSRSESESETPSSSNQNSWCNWKDEKKNKQQREILKIEKSNSHLKSMKNTLQQNGKEKSILTEPIEPILSTSRCRQSKKRAEERISRAFEEESILYDLAFESKKHSIKNIKTMINDEKLDKKDKKIITDNTELSTINNDNDDKLKKYNEIDKLDNSNSPSIKTKIICTNDISSQDNNSIESIHTPAPSCPRERSSTPDIVSMTTRDSDNDAEEPSDIDNDDDDIVRGRLSPTYTTNLPESSIDSTSNISHKNIHTEKIIDTTKSRNLNEFTGEKIVIRSPVSIHENTGGGGGGVVTIAPTDAIEDNALDVSQEIKESINKSRQGKVLNFDEELFVECCSRLKATTENELRGTKKIKLDHSENYQNNDEQSQEIKPIRDRWRDVESQNSLGSLLDSVNQLLGEEMYNNNRVLENTKRARSQRSDRPISPAVISQPDFIRPDNLGYEDSLDVAFEHNNKLRDKIQQRMRESENLIATSFGQKVSHNNSDSDDHRYRHHHHHHHHHHRHHHHHHDKNLSKTDKNVENLENLKAIDNSLNHYSSDDIEIKHKNNNPNIDGFLDKALSNLLHNNGKHDHNGSTPMNVLAELACAQVPTITDVKTSREKLSIKTSLNDKDTIQSQTIQKCDKELPRKNRNTIKELFERKNEIIDRKYNEKIANITNCEKLEQNISKQKSKKKKNQNEFPLIRKSQFGGMPERKRRQGSCSNIEKKHDDDQDKIKDIYDFDDEDSQSEKITTTTSYRNKNDNNSVDENVSEILMDDLMTRAIKKTLDSGRSSESFDKTFDNMIERKFKEFESFAPKTKGALKAFHIEEKNNERIMGPMDTFVERKKRERRLTETSTTKSIKQQQKKRHKNMKKRSKNSWYENDSSDEFKTVVKTAEDIGVGISKSQRTCSKGKQNLFAELSTSSESEYENDDNNDTKKMNKLINLNEIKNPSSPEIADNYPSDNENCKIENWMDISSKTDSKNNIDHKKSESDMSDLPLVIDERKDDYDDDDDNDNNDKQNNSGDETDNRSERAFELDDLYREDSSVADSDCDDNNQISQVNCKNHKDNNIDDDNDLIPLDEALNMLDGPETFQQSSGIIKLSSDFITTKKNDEDNFSDIQKNDNIVTEIIDDTDDTDVQLPEKLLTNSKPEKTMENLPLHVFLSRKVQESKKRKEEQLKKMQDNDNNDVDEINGDDDDEEEEEEEEVVHEYQPARRQRKCAIGKQGLLAEISSSDEEYFIKENPTKRTNDKLDNEKLKKPKRESKEKRKERYLEKKHEQIIAKEQKAIEEEIHREFGIKKDTTNNDKIDTDNNNNSDDEKIHKKYQKNKKIDNTKNKDKTKKENLDKFNNDDCESKKIISTNKKKVDRDLLKNKKKQTQLTNNKNCKKNSSKIHVKLSTTGKNKNTNDKSRSSNKDTKERRSSITKRDSDDEELRTTKRWNNVDEGVGVAIGRRKRAAANQLYYWSSSSDDDEELIQPAPVVEEEDDRQEQHGWIVGDSHKRMITMLAMEKQLKEKRRRSEEDFDSNKSKNKKHRNSMS
ncbi:protein PFC0760c isoform X1 [Aphidius gifuensis]|nr:protein PFC0760c isoform X1 [Aphidius gifuensis]